MIQISAYWSIVLIVLVYAGVQHLLNWGFRKDEKQEFIALLLIGEGLATGAMVGGIYEILQNQI